MRGQVFTAQLAEATKPLPRVGASVIPAAGREKTMAMNAEGSNKTTADTNRSNVTTHDYQELSKLLEDFFAV